MSKIANAFTPPKNSGTNTAGYKKAFIPFITCGDPDLETTAACVRAMAAAGADIIELGIPFSDPTAEGPVIMEANERALRAGVTTDKIFEMVTALRTGSDGGAALDLPLVFMTYANVVYSYAASTDAAVPPQTGKPDDAGIRAFATRCEVAGIDGLILPDVPFEEKDEFASICTKHNVELISMVAPTSASRIGLIAGKARGFIYIVSSLGVTGVRSEIKTDIGDIVAAIRKASDTPCAVGFGISTPKQAARMASIADGAIVGSAIVKIIAREKKAAPAAVKKFVEQMASAVHAV